jgi:hypothetical protein
MVLVIKMGTVLEERTTKEQRFFFLVWTKQTALANSDVNAVRLETVLDERMCWPAIYLFATSVRLPNATCQKRQI